MIYWAQLLHFYQPPTQIHSVLDKVSQEAYRPLMRVFRRYPQARATFNINGCLLDMFHCHGKTDILRALRELGESGQVELTGSGQYHPILPLIPKEETERQILQNARDLKEYVGQEGTPRGFFPPEMAYSPQVGEMVLNMGYEWVILSGLACAGDWPVDTIAQKKVGDKKLAVFFRDDVLSNRVSFERVRGRQFISNLVQLYGKRKDAYVITALDAETFGHHIHGWDRFFLGEAFAALDDAGTSEVQSVTISQLLDLFPRGPVMEPKSSSWSTSAADIEANNPYPLWKDKGNEVHRLQWEHLKVCIDLNRAAQQWGQAGMARGYADHSRALLDRALHSCQFWWASRRPMWDINLIQWGLNEQWAVAVNAYQAVNLSTAPTEVKEDSYYRAVAARHLRNRIEDFLFS